MSPDDFWNLTNCRYFMSLPVTKRALWSAIYRARPWFKTTRGAPERHERLLVEWIGQDLVDELREEYKRWAMVAPNEAANAWLASVFHAATGERLATTYWTDHGERP